MVDRRALKHFLRWTQRGLFAVGLSILAYCGFVLVDGWVFQNRERRQLEQLLLQVRHSTPGLPAVLAAASANGLIGSMEIPRLGLSVMVVEGVRMKTLRRAAGHIPGTALPGEPGNVGISAHRDTYFRPLRNIRQDDIITLTTMLGEYRYRVVSTRIVSPDDVAVLESGNSQTLTLVTCYPFYFVGPAPDRFIVRAERTTL